MKRLLLTTSFLISISTYANHLDSLVGEFFSEDHHMGTRITLTSEGKYVLEMSSEMSEMKTEGTWIQKAEKIFLAPKKSSGFSAIDNSTIKDPWTNKITEIYILDRNKLFIKDGDDHIHFKRVNKSDQTNFEIDFELNKHNPPLKKLVEVATQLKEMSSSGNLKILLYDFSSKSELMNDKYIGVKRCKEIIDYLSQNSGVRNNAFVICPWPFLQSSHQSYVHIEALTFEYVPQTNSK